MEENIGLHDSQDSIRGVLGQQFWMGILKPDHHRENLGEVIFWVRCQPFPASETRQNSRNTEIEKGQNITHFSTLWHGKYLCPDAIHPYTPKHSLPGHQLVPEPPLEAAATLACSSDNRGTI